MNRRSGRARGICTWVEALEPRVLLSAATGEADGALPKDGSPSAALSYGSGQLVAVVSSQPFVDTVSQMHVRDTTGSRKQLLAFFAQGDSIAFPKGKQKKQARQTVAGTAALADAAQTVSTNFTAISLQDQFNAFGSGSFPPDTMGAIGPNNFVEVINSSVAIYSRSGTLQSHVSLNNFFAVTVSGTTYPQGGGFDPRVLYDRTSGRWFATAMEFGNPWQTNNDVILAVSATSDPTGVWNKFLIPIGVPNAGATTFFTDYSTLGVDSNGVYLAGHIFPSAGTDFVKIVATPMAPLLAASPSLGSVFQWAGITDMYATPQPAYSFDPVGPTAPAWFVSSSATLAEDVAYRTLTWSGGTPTLSATGTLVTPAYGNPVNAPAKSSTTAINVGDDRLMMAIVRNGQLWTARNVGVNSSGGASSSNRTAAEWLQIDVSTGTPALVQSGRLYDSAASSPVFYYYPSVMVRGQGHMVMGVSGSNSSKFVGFYTAGRLATDSAGTIGSPTLVRAGQAAYKRNDPSGRNRWGDYSYTSLDPNDDMSAWSVGEYAATGTNIWGTYVAKVLAPAPTLSNPGGSGLVGQSNVTLNLAGTGLYDPGAGFTNRLAVGFSGTGITVSSITYNSATSASVNLSIAGNAASGARSITLTNPDGQNVTVSNAFTVNAGATISGLAFVDKNGNGVQDAGEGVLTGVTINLGNGVTTTTDGSGNYSFGVAAGTYPLTETAPTGYIADNGNTVVASAGQTYAGENFANSPVTFTSVAGGAQYYVQLDATGTLVQISLGTASQVTPAYQILRSTLNAAAGAPGLTFNLSGGKDILSLDFSHGSPIPTGNIHFAGGGAASDELRVYGAHTADSYAMSDTQIGPTGGGAIFYTGIGTMTLATLTANYTGTFSTFGNLNIAAGTVFNFI